MSSTCDISPRTRRILAALIDVGVSSLPFYVFFVFFLKWSMENYSLVTVFAIGVASLYFVLLEGPLGQGRTLGKRLFKLRVVGMGGHIISYRQSFLRTFYGSLLPSLLGLPYWALNSPINANVSSFGFLFFASLSLAYWTLDASLLFIDPARRTLHDHLAKTGVVYQTGPYEEKITADFISTHFHPFPYRRLWISGIVVMVVLVGNALFFLGLDILDMPNYAFIGKTRHNFIMTGNQFHQYKDIRYLPVIEAKEVDEATRQENIKNLLNELVPKEKLEGDQIPYGIMIIPSPASSFSLFNIKELVHTTLEGVNTYIYNSDNESVIEKTRDGPYAFFDHKIPYFKKPWKSYGNLEHKNFTIRMYENTKEWGHLYLASTKDDKNMTFADMFQEYGKKWKDLRLTYEEEYPLQIKEVGRIPVKDCQIHYPNGSTSTALEGTLLINAEKLLFLYEFRTMDSQFLTDVLQQTMDLNHQSRTRNQDTNPFMTQPPSQE